MPGSNLEPIDERDKDMRGKFSNVDQRHSGSLERSQLMKEAGKEVAGEIEIAEKEEAYEKILSKVKKDAPAAVENQIGIDAASVSETIDAENQINHLVAIAEQKGVVHAVKVAMQLEQNYAYILDQFHDKVLADQLHDALVKNGMLEEV